MLTAIDKDNSLNVRMSVREQHMAFVKETGVVRLGGPFLDAKGDMAGSLIIFEATDMDAAKAWNARDPYMKAGLFQSTDIRPWKMTANFCEARL
ncbi:MAG TPA: YciI family protein [Micropepsaceae bacterium]